MSTNGIEKHSPPDKREFIHIFKFLTLYFYTFHISIILSMPSDATRQSDGFVFEADLSQSLKNSDVTKYISDNFSWANSELENKL